MYKISGALLAVLFVLTLASPVFATADTDQESPFKTHLSDVEVKDQNAVPPDTTTDTAIPPGDSAHPDGNHQGQTQTPDPNGQPKPETPTNGTSENNHNSGSQTEGVITPTPAPIDGANTSGTNTNGTNTDGTNTESTSTNPEKIDNVSTPDNRSWFEKLVDKGEEIVANPIESLKNFAKGAGAGAIGAAIVITAVVAVALIISAPISVPLLIVAGVVGVVAGGIYGLMSGDDFDFVKGIGYGAMATITVLSIASSGIGAAFKGAGQLIKSVGLRGALKTAGSRSLSYLSGLKNAMGSFVKSPIKSLLTTVKSSTFKWSTGLNFFFNMSNHLATEGKLTLGDMGFISLQSVASSLLFTKAGDVLKTGVGSKFGKNIVAYISATAESLSVAWAKNKINPEKNMSVSEQLGKGFMSAFVVAPAFSRMLKGIRGKLNIGTTEKDLKTSQISTHLVLTNKRRSMSNPDIQKLWNDERKLALQRGAIMITNAQKQILSDNLSRLNPYEKASDVLKKVANTEGNKVVKKLFDPTHSTQSSLENNRSSTGGEKQK